MARYWKIGNKKVKKRYGYHEQLSGRVGKHQYKWDQYLKLNRYKRRKKKDRELRKRYRKW